METAVKSLIEELYQRAAQSDRGAIYSLLDPEFQSRYSLSEFNRLPQFRRIDLGKLLAVEQIDPQEDVYLVKCRLRIREEDVYHTYRVGPVDDPKYIVANRFMFN